MKNAFCKNTEIIFQIHSRKENSNPDSKKKKTVLMAASVASMIGQFNLPNIQLLKKMGYEVHAACNFREGNTCDENGICHLKHTLRQMQVPFYQWDCPRDLYDWRKCLQAYMQLLRIIKHQKFAMIHCHSPIGAALARAAAHKEKIPVIYTAHGFHFYRGAPLKNWLLYFPAEKLLAAWTDVLVTVNYEDYAFAKRHLRAGKIFHISGIGIDTKRYAGQEPAVRDELRREFRRGYQIPQDAVLLLSVGELSVRKNHRIVLEALAAMKRQDVYYLICGQGALLDTLAAYAKQLGVDRNVRLAGYMECVETAYYAADIFVLPSVQEGLPAALMEAMAAGLPCIVSDIRGNRELITGGRQIFKTGGMRFHLNDREQLKDALEKFADNRSLREQCGQVNRASSRRYDLTHVSRKMKQIYRICLPVCEKKKGHGRAESVQVLLSSYNGEAYIEEQIDSIICQQGIQVKLLIRDDGSTDGTLKKVQESAGKYSNIHFYQGSNVGVQKSFFDLMAHADTDADYYAFADQDDIWLPGKLRRAVEILQCYDGAGCPLLYAGSVIYADEDKRQLKPSACCGKKRSRGKKRHYGRKKTSFGNALLENICMGCTEVFNRELLELAVSHRPSCGILHDWWMYLTASCFGKVLYDHKALIYYRQHPGNAVGMAGSLLERWKRRICNMRKYRGMISRQAEDFYIAYADTAEDAGISKKDAGKCKAGIEDVRNCENFEFNIRLAAKVSIYKKNWKQRCSTVFDQRIYRQDKIDDLIYRILFLAGFL